MRAMATAIAVGEPYVNSRVSEEAFVVARAKAKRQERSYPVLQSALRDFAKIEKHQASSKALLIIA